MPPNARSPRLVEPQTVKTLKPAVRGRLTGVEPDVPHAALAGWPRIHDHVDGHLIEADVLRPPQRRKAIKLEAVNAIIDRTWRESEKPLIKASADRRHHHVAPSLGARTFCHHNSPFAG
jgi:hypothetical protein